MALTAHPVDQETARIVAIKFMKAQDLTMATTYQTDKGTSALYVFNTLDGFVIVSADDCETPIVGYSHEGPFCPDDIPIQMEEYLQDFVERIQYGIENHLTADETTARQWALVKTTGRLNENKSAKAVEPLITSHWHQGCLYNSLCPPIESQPCGHAEVGCVAVAMAQIINYWKFPSRGRGYHAYYSVHGTLAADFENTTYHYELIPDILSDSSTDEEIEAVATLLYHCGISVNMSYTESGSGAHSSDVPNALRIYFKYSDEMHRESMKDHPDDWLDLLKNCIDEERPILYSGQGSGGHAFVCDGYDENDLLHFNWGWGGNGDGYFALNHLNPLGHNYNTSNAAIFDIIPDKTQHLVSATANPPYGGTVEGNGLYLSDQPCTLTAIPAENFEFSYWKRDNLIISYQSTYSFFTSEDIDNIEAVFSLRPVQNITANAASQDLVELTWSSQNPHSWPLLKEFDIDKAQSIATDGNYIYICKKDSQYSFWEYSTEGSYINDWTSGIYSPSCLTYDGHYLYCNGNSSAYLYSFDMSSHSWISSIRTGYTPICSYDPIRHGLWIAPYDSQHQAYKLQLVDCSGATILSGPILPSEVVPNGSGFFVGDDRDTHLVVKTEEGMVYDYDVEQDLFYQCNADLGTSYGSYICYQEGKPVMYVCYDNDVKLYGISDAIRPWPITHYRLYRSDDKGNVTLLSDETIGTSYTDSTWSELGVGLYRFGISSVYGNGNESDIVWSNALAKGNYDVDDIQDSEEPSVIKAYENGRIVIIKDGKKYNITGQNEH